MIHLKRARKSELWKKKERQRGWKTFLGVFFLLLQCITLSFVVNKNLLKEYPFESSQFFLSGTTIKSDYDFDSPSLSEAFASDRASSDGHESPTIAKATAMSPSTAMKRTRCPPNANCTSIRDEQGREQQQQLIPTIDIISVGSHGEAKNMAAQAETFGSHPSVRSFRKFTESDDHEKHCHKLLSTDSIAFVSRFCRSQHTDHFELMRFRSQFASANWLAKKEDRARGWMCAFKRPAESLYKVLKEYASTAIPSTSDYTTFSSSDTGTNRITNSNSSVPMPDYLVLLDADTYLNMDNIAGHDGSLGFLPSMYPFNQTLVIAGCRVRWRVFEHNFTFPWGGFGTIFTKRSIERFVHPIQDCNISDANDDPLLDPETKQSLKTLNYRELTQDEFERLACAKLKEDSIGEAFLFQPGMSVADLMYQYVTNWKYVDAEKHWKTTMTKKTTADRIENKRTNGGFCLHADWVIGYFVNHYYLSNNEFGVDDPFWEDNPEQRVMAYNGSEHYAGILQRKNILARKECSNDYDSNCDPVTAHFCHHISESFMRILHNYNGTNLKTTNPYKFELM